MTIPPAFGGFVPQLSARYSAQSKKTAPPLVLSPKSAILWVSENPIRSQLGLGSEKRNGQKMKSSIAQRNFIKSLLEQKNIGDNKWSWLTSSTKQVGDNGYLSSLSSQKASTLISDLKKFPDSENPLRAGSIVRSR